MPCAAEGDFAAITPDAALCVYRIAQEALRNVIAHAGASRADVRLLLIGGEAQITIADDGRGFDATDRVERDKGLGLVSIAERARIIGGTVSIVSGPNQGTRGTGEDSDERAREVARRLWNRGASRLTRRPTVLLADDHTIVTDGLSRILREADLDVVGAVRDGQRLIDEATRLRPDVIITDLSMPGLTGLDVLARLKAEHLDSKVIVLTTVDASADYFPGLTDWGRHRLQVNASVRREVWKDVFVALSLYDTFDSVPPSSDAARNDVGVAMSIGWSP